MIQILEGTRVATMGFPWYVVAFDEAEEGRSISEAFVYVIDDDNRVSRESRQRFIFDPGPSLGTPEDFDKTGTLLDSVHQFAIATIQHWQWEKYKRIKARCVLTPSVLQDVGVRLLYRLWMGRFADKQLKKMHDHTASLELKTLLSRMFKLPQFSSD